MIPLTFKKFHERAASYMLQPVLGRRILHPAKWSMSRGIVNHKEKPQVMGFDNPFTQTRLNSPPRYTHAPRTHENLEYADLTVIDLAQSGTLEGRAILSSQLTRAMTTHGFFYAVNHGYTQTQTNHIFDIANLTFDFVTPEEKVTYTGDVTELGSYEGYKPRQYWCIEPGVYDQIEHYNINRKIYHRGHPLALRPFLPDIKAFAKHCHFNVLHPILRLLALGLEMHEDTLVNIHNYDASGETSVRFMKYYPRSEEEEVKSNNIWLKGHTDFGSVTILWSQPVGGLQIRSPEGKWQWIRHIDNALVVNAGDALQFFSGGFYKPTIHRVVQPPVDQQSHPRLGLFYFCQPDNDVKLVPFESSPVVQRVGIRHPSNDAPTMKEWRSDRSISYGRIELEKNEKEKIETEVIRGVQVNHYN